MPSERVFSSAGITDTARCNRLSPRMFSALQSLKDAYRDGRLKPEVGEWDGIGIGGHSLTDGGMKSEDEKF